MKSKILDFVLGRKRHLNKDYKIVAKLKFLSVIPIMKFTVTKTRLEKMKIKEKIKDIDFTKLEKMPSFDKDILKIFKELKLEIKKINLYVDIGTENVGLTSIIVPAVSTLIAILLRRNIRKFKRENQKFTINPVYQNQNLVNFYISGIFEIKMRHIINVIYYFVKKERNVKKYERTSNRRSYDYSYE